MWGISRMEERIEVSNIYMIWSVLHKLVKDFGDSIPQANFTEKVKEVKETLLKTGKPDEIQQADLLEKEEIRIITAIRDNKTKFHAETVGMSSNLSLDFDFTITPSSGGGRRSKTRRTKKGKRKGRGRKTRQRK